MAAAAFGGIAMTSIWDVLSVDEGQLVDDKASSAVSSPLISPKVDGGARRIKRFYQNASFVDEGEEGYAVVLDGKFVKTPQGRRVALSSKALASAIAHEWAEQAEWVNPASMPLMRFATTMLDGVTQRRAEVEAMMGSYAATDLLCYRAEFPQELAALQTAQWDPIVRRVEQALGVRFQMAIGVMPIQQDDGVSHAMRTWVDTLSSEALTALADVTTLTGSLILTYAGAQNILTADDVFQLAHLDEHFQASQWGSDFEATERLALRSQSLLLAMRFYALSLGEA
jgi:chaperone required for assembly of F1-ATPase